VVAEAFGLAGVISVTHETAGQLIGPHAPWPRTLRFSNQLPSRPAHSILTLGAPLSALAECVTAKRSG